ncbi:MAG: PAS domain-containing protein, partial [Candidatus Aminicenantes bacterium]|nr:PAS domain-containing protein [Candidatus Aminicenantes bacterium]
MSKENEVTKEFLDNILASMDGGVFTVDKNARITTFNRAAEEITGFKKEEVLNKECRHILKSDLCKEKCPLKETLET